MKLTSLEIETLIANSWDIRKNMIISNVSWGLDIHECDLLIVSKSNYATEIEIKITKSDLKADAKKIHGHRSNKIKYLYFAIPEKLESCIDLIPARAGIIIIRKKKNIQYNWERHFYIDTIRKPETNKQARPLNDSELIKVSKLAMMRMWNLKNRVLTLQKELKSNGRNNKRTN